MVRNIVVALCMLLTSVTLTAQEYDGGDDTLRRSVPDTLRRTYRHTEAVRRYTIERDTVGAVGIWQKIIAEDSCYAPAHYYLSQLSEDDDMALGHARRAFVADSSNKWYVRNYATKLIDEEQFELALPAYRRLLSLDRHDISTYYGLAYAYGRCDMLYSAIAVLDSADIRLGRNPAVFSFKQQLLLETRQYDRAIDDSEGYISEFPYDIDARIELANTYHRAGRDTMVLRTLSEAQRVDSLHVGVLMALSAYHAQYDNISEFYNYERMLMRSDDLTVSEKVRRVRYFTSDDEYYASEYFRIGSIIQALALKHPDAPEVVDLYSSHLLVAGELEQALDYLRRHLNDAAADVNDYIFAMQLEYYLERDDLLFEDMATALELYPTKLELLTFASFVYGEKGGTKRAIQILKSSLSVVESDEDISTIWGYIGDIYHEEGKDKRAFAIYDKALGYNPDNHLVLNNYAYFLSLRDEQLERALQMSTRAIAIEPQNSNYLDTHAWVLHRLGRNDEAKSIMRQALSLSSQQDANLLMHYGDILWALGESFLAETYWEKAVDNGYDAEEMERHKASLMKQ